MRKMANTYSGYNIFWVTKPKLCCLDGLRRFGVLAFRQWPIWGSTVVPSHVHRNTSHEQERASFAIFWANQKEILKEAYEMIEVVVWLIKPVFMLISVIWRTRHQTNCVPYKNSMRGNIHLSAVKLSQNGGNKYQNSPGQDLSSWQQNRKTPGIQILGFNSKGLP